MISDNNRSHEPKWNGTEGEFEIAVYPLFPNTLKTYGIKVDSEGNASGGATKAFCKEAVADWRGFIDENENEIPCTPKNVQKACTQVHNIFDLIVIWGIKYANEIHVVEAAEEKNSESPSSGIKETASSSVTQVGHVRAAENTGKEQT